MSKRYTVSDGKMVLTLEAAEEGGYIVTSPLNPELITEAETIEEAFANARDAAKGLKRSRTRLMPPIVRIQKARMSLIQWIAGSSNNTCASMAVSCAITEPNMMSELIPQTLPRSRCRDTTRSSRGQYEASAAFWAYRGRRGSDQSRFGQSNRRAMGNGKE